MPHKVLLTGGAGYVGSHTYVALVEAGYDVVILDDFSNADHSVIDRLAHITGRDVPVFEGSVLDHAFLQHAFDQHAFDAVIHFAARKAVGESVADPLGYFDTNIGGLITLLRVMQGAGCSRLVYSSSATVYGVPDQAPTPETAPLCHINPYGFTKIMGEEMLAQLAHSASDTAPWSFGILRYFNPAGAHPSGLIGEDPRDIPNNLMPYLAKVASGELNYLNIFGDDYPTRDGTGERDYIHVCDLARGHVLSLEALLERGQGHVVNLGTGRAYSVREVHAAYSRAVGRELPYKITPRRAGDVPIYQADVTRARDLLGFEAQYGLDAMCETSWNWIVNGAQKAPK